MYRAFSRRRLTPCLIHPIRPAICDLKQVSMFGNSVENPSGGVLYCEYTSKMDSVE